jgi:hypothetical protein
VLAALVGCADTPPEARRSTPISGPSTGAFASQVAELTTRGCRPHVGNPVVGTVGVRSGNRVHRFDCTGVSGERVREGVRRFLETGRVDDGLAHALVGFSIRHYLGTQRFCSRTVYSYYLGDVLLGTEVVWHEGSCIDVSYFWDEWIGGNLDEPLPEESPGGGGPYYGPTSPPDRTPRVDTTEVDHYCDGLNILDRVNWRCLRPISSLPLDSLRIWGSLRPHFRPLSDISPLSVRQKCDSLQRWFGDALQYHHDSLAYWPLINRGATDATRRGKLEHDAQTSGSFLRIGRVQPFHIDPRILDSAGSASGKRKLLEAVVHEVIHAMKIYDHPD